MVCGFGIAFRSYALFPNLIALSVCRTAMPGKALARGLALMPLFVPRMMQGIAVGFPGPPRTATGSWRQQDKSGFAARRPMCGNQAKGQDKDVVL